MTKQEIKEIRKLLYQVVSRLDKISPAMGSIKIKEDDFTESGKAIIESWIPRGQFMIKKLDKIINLLPKEPKKRTIKSKVNTYILKGWTLTRESARPEVDCPNYDTLSNWEITPEDKIKDISIEIPAIIKKKRGRPPKDARTQD